MLPCLNHYLSSSIVLKSFLSSFTKISLSLIHKRHHPLRHYRCPLYVKAFSMNHLSMNRLSRSCSSSAALSVTATLPINERSIKSNKSRKKARLESSEMTLKRNLDLCSKSGDLVEALRLYDAAKSNGVRLSQPHYNNLLYLCSSYGCSSSGDIGLDGGGGACDVELDLGSKWGFEIFRQMTGNKVAPNEATFTSMARLSARMEDPEMAFDLVKQMKEYGIVPKLRSYEPALHGFCKKREAEKAYEVDAHMTQDGVVVDESGLSALLKLSSDVKKADKVYEMLHRLRSTVRQVAESTAIVMENWFKSEAAIEVGDENWDMVKVREGFKKGGGGWHGQGWLGSGEWNVVRTGMNEKGVCRSCGEKLVCIDIDPMETENFASSLANLACQKEVKADFKEFQVWH